LRQALAGWLKRILAVPVGECALGRIRDTREAKAVREGEVRERAYIIWFVGSAVWWIDAALVLHRGSRSRALTSLAIAIVFFAAGMFFQRFAPKR
jgi:hypothetical protein